MRWWPWISPYEAHQFTLIDLLPITTRMNDKFAIIIIGTLSIVASYWLFANFVSAETNCYTSGEKYVCVFTSDDPPAKAVIFCDKDGNNCTVTWLDKETVVTPDVKNAIQKAEITNFGSLSPESASNPTGDKNSTSPKGMKVPGIPAGDGGLTIQK